MNDCERKIQGLEAKLARQSTMLAEALKEKNDVLQKTSGAQRQADAFREENVRLQAELKQWKPPAPKFKTGEVVACIKVPGVFYKTGKIEWDQYNRIWVYEFPNYSVGYVEEYLRKLTPQERGQ